MNELKNLIWFTHPIAMCDAISAVENGQDIDEAALEVVMALYTDDAFNEYSEDELQSAVAEEISDNL